MGCSGSRAQDVGELPEGTEQLQRTPTLATEMCELLTASWAGSSTGPPELAFDWCMGPELQGNFDDLARRQALLRWISTFMVELVFAAGPKGAVLACRKPDGSIGGMALLKIYRGKDGDDLCAMHHGASRAGGRSAETHAYMNCPRMKALVASQKEIHDQCGLRSYVYVQAVAVDPSAQGQGMGGKLMRAASAVADREGLACYLEATGARNQQIYKKYGYEVKAEAELRTKARKGKLEEVFEHKMAAMVRPSSASAPPKQANPSSPSRKVAPAQPCCVIELVPVWVDS